MRFPKQPADTARSAPIRYYRADIAALSFQECWRFGGGFWRGMRIVVFKLLRVRPAVGDALPWPADFQDNRIGEAEVPNRAKETMAPLLEEWKRLGFHFLAYQTVKHRLTPSEIVAASFLHPSGEVVAKVSYFNHACAAGSPPRVHCSLISWLQSGDFLVTSNEPMPMQPAPRKRASSIPGAQPETLLQLHTKRMAECRTSDSLRLTRCIEDYGELADSLESASMDYYLRRGLLVEMSDSEVESARERYRIWQATGNVEQPPRRFADYVLWGFGVWFCFEVIRWLFRIDLGAHESFIRGASLVLCLAGGALWGMIVHRNWRQMHRP